MVSGWAVHWDACVSLIGSNAMHELNTLLENFDYDLWANREWLAPSEYAGLSLVMWHIVFGQQIWIARCKGGEYVQPENPNAAQHLEPTNLEWKTFLAGSDLDASISYTNLRGDHFSNTIRDIANHVIMHGVYHRGDMRGRCEMLGKPFPETDRIAFSRLKHAVS